MAKLIDLTGQTFVRWTVLHRVENSKNGDAKWLCQCGCGVKRPVLARSLRNGDSTSCGCLSAERLARRRKHSWCEKAEYRAWKAIKRRCLNPKDAKFPDYGGRGIKVCDRWLNSFEAFLEDMGARPSLQHSIDRIDNNGHYEPGNCRWATSSQQNKNTRSNRRYVYQGREQCLSDWASELGIKYTTLRARLEAGHTVDSAFKLSRTGRQRTA